MPFHPKKNNVVKVTVKISLGSGTVLGGLGEA